MGYVYTAGNHIDPIDDTSFVWRVRTTNDHIYTVSHMIYTNRALGQPVSGSGPACMGLIIGSYQWYDAGCTKRYCAVCEVDL